MIKISLNDESNILDFHYKNVTVRKGREWNLNYRINKLRAKHVGTSLATMYRFLLRKIVKDKNGFSILTAKPDLLKNFIVDFENRYAVLLTDDVKDEILWAFNYDDSDKWKAYELAKKINVSVCPYCNRQYTFIVGNDLKKGTRFEYDHFFAKHLYPYLSLSFFNLIPSCHVCNSNFKGKKEFDLNTNIHPYQAGFSSDIVFSIKPKNIKFINGNSGAYRIRFKKGLGSTWTNQKVKAAFDNITTFQLTKLYNMHKDYVDEIIQKSIVYNPVYLDDLFKKYHGTLFKNKEDVYRFVLGNYTEEHHQGKRVLSKLTMDIAKELGII